MEYITVFSAAFTHIRYIQKCILLGITRFSDDNYKYKYVARIRIFVIFATLFFEV